ncbi:alanine racemase [Curvibacter gracilis]|uniref:alanine racemase n=1 Tax=Curvibacter gracilis TaxID=230310 RepID=UPI0004AC5D83|nr:alanine racemase [Curvibacter gracilis]
MSSLIPDTLLTGFTLTGRYKNFPQAAAARPAAELSELNWQLLNDDLPYPMAVLSEAALRHNLAWMQRYANDRGVQLAPHGKTSLSPELFALQLQAGAWGLTFATVYQAAVGVAAGARRVIIANQVLADADLDGLQALLGQHPDLRVWFLVDSTAQLALIEDWAARRAGSRPFEVLLEVGIPGKRTGCRSLEQALTLARALAASQAVLLGGIECYEGGAAICDSTHDSREVTDLVRRVLAIARACDDEGLLSGDEILLTAGGSAVFDLVLPLLQAQGLSRPVCGVLRSGCYITHDHGNYQRFLKLLEQREGLADSLQAALTVWALVQSVPEPGLALLSCGRRDLSYDLEMPVPLQMARRGVRSLLQAQAVPADWRIDALNDHHAYLRFDPAGPVPAVGDRVGLGISHPCTTFDKWRWMPVLDEQGRVVSAISTHF